MPDGIRTSGGNLKLRGKIPLGLYVKESSFFCASADSRSDCESIIKLDFVVRSRMSYRGWTDEIFANFPRISPVCNHTLFSPDFDCILIFIVRRLNDRNFRQAALIALRFAVTSSLPNIISTIIV